jgi:hypothetical protein
VPQHLLCNVPRLATLFIFSARSPWFTRTPTAHEF